MLGDTHHRLGAELTYIGADEARLPPIPAMLLGTHKIAAKLPVIVAEVPSLCSLPATDRVFLCLPIPGHLKFSSVDV